MNRAVSFVIGFALEVICFPSVHGAGFRPGPVIVPELITLKARLPADISQRCAPARRRMKRPHVLPSEGEAITESHKSNRR